MYYNTEHKNTQEYLQRTDSVFLPIIIFLSLKNKNKQAISDRDLFYDNSYTFVFLIAKMFRC